MRTVVLEGLGCRLNISETGTLAKSFVERGFEIIPFGKCADVTLINTCTVTSKAEASCRNLIRRARRFSPAGKIIIIGCYAQISSLEIKESLDVDLILGSFEKGRVFKFLDQSFRESPSETIVEISESDTFFESATTVDDFHTRSFLKIQDGCDYLCAYCIIPYARGRSRSLSIEKVLESAKDLLKNGFKEIVLTGVNINDYNGSSGERLPELVSEIIKLKDLKRLRLTSLAPNIINESFIKSLKNSSIYMDYFHLSLQSGDDGILRLMRRRYNTSEFKRAVKLIKKNFKDAGIGVDVIVGFPGESESSYKKTLKLLNDLPITHFHVFPYSKREGTTSSKLRETISSSQKKEFSKELIALGDKKLQEFSQSFVGEKLSVLFEKKDGDFFEGLSSNFLKVKVKSDTDLKNEIHLVSIKSYEFGYLLGEKN